MLNQICKLFNAPSSNSSDIESYGEGIEVVEEWSYFEDEDIKPRILRLFRNMQFVSRTQWTIKAMIG